MRATDNEAASSRANRRLAWAMFWCFLLPIVALWVGAVVWMAAISQWAWFWALLSVLLLILIACGSLIRKQVRRLARR